MGEHKLQGDDQQVHTEVELSKDSVPEIAGDLRHEVMEERMQVST